MHESISTRVVAGLGGLSPATWDGAFAQANNPFLDHAFLRLLETSGSVGADTAWLPSHVLAYRGDALVGALLTYVKTDSYGEFIWDFAWAEASLRAGLPYYPKLTVSVPFTPATGPRLLVSSVEAQPGAVRAALVGQLRTRLQAGEASGAHVLYCTDEESAWLSSQGFVRRATHQYHWHNDGYRSFEDFLAALRSENRKQVRRERRRVVEQGVQVELRYGHELGDADWAALYPLYRSTTDRKWGSAWLTPEFFAGARGELDRRALIGLARRDGQLIACSISFEKGEHVYGRYWGAREPVDCLHFELCYYQLIEHAIATGKTLIEAGAQGEHKLKRGFAPVIIHSAHLLVHQGLHEAVTSYVDQERAALEAALPELERATPFREGAGPRRRV